MTQKPLLSLDSSGLGCESGRFHVDPWRPVDQAVITHGHADHARSGSKAYFCAEGSGDILRQRLSGDFQLTEVPYRKKFKLGKTWVSFHPAGHVLGSAQVRVEGLQSVWVVSGDYKRNADPTCEGFEEVPCDVFISEATFAMPVYHWKEGIEVVKDLQQWWSSEPNHPSILFCYAFGKAQRVLAELSKLTDRTVYLHGAIETLMPAYRNRNVSFVPNRTVSSVERGHAFAGDLILAPPSAHRSAWMKRFKNPQTAFASGWMQIRGARRRRGYERGFVLSDHADWSGLVRSILASQAKTVYLTHGQTEVLSRFLMEEHGLDVKPLKTRFGDEQIEEQFAESVS